MGIFKTDNEYPLLGIITPSLMTLPTTLTILDGEILLNDPRRCPPRPLVCEGEVVGSIPWIPLDILTLGELCGSNCPLAYCISGALVNCVYQVRSCLLTIMVAKWKHEIRHVFTGH
jgi:hypothetical protein